MFRGLMATGKAKLPEDDVVVQDFVRRVRKHARRLREEHMFDATLPTRDGRGEIPQPGRVARDAV